MDRATLIQAMEATAAGAAKPIAVPTEKWGTVFVRVLTVAEVDAQSADEKTEDGSEKTRLARSACRVLCDESGARLFDANNAADVALLSSQPWPLLRQVLTAANEEAGNA